MKYVDEINEIVKRKWRSTSKGWKVLLLILVVLLAVTGVVVLFLWLFGKLVKAMTAGGYRNAGLYLPRVRRW